MLFSSNVFLFAFLPAVLLAYYCLPRRLRNSVLLLFSLVFYGWGEPVYLLLMAAVIMMNYLCGLWIGRGSGKTGLTVGVALNLLVLGYFKYSGFLLGGLVPEVALPIGISFYIFQSMSYIIDVYRRTVSVQKNPLLFGTYVTLFPQLIAGPIVRYQDVAEQLEHRQENIAQFASGWGRFLVGLAKKMLLANPMGSLWEQLQETQGTAAAWVGLLAYTLQIYFDFSGYSDMAIGLGRMFGFEFLENFQYPYICISVTEFWRRWHISLSTWFKEYVYIPLGGNRRGLAVQLRNIALVWLLTGLWHGASWNYVLWGGYYALLLAVEKLWLLKRLRNMPRAFGRVYAMLAVMLGWALFYFEDLSALWAFLARLVQPVSSADAAGTMLACLPTLAAALIAATPVLPFLSKRFEQTALWRYGRLPALVVLLLLCVGALATQSYNPFIYFRF